jgi:hypothetical protein
MSSRGSKFVFCHKKDKTVSSVVNDNEKKSYTVHVMYFICQLLFYQNALILGLLQCEWLFLTIECTLQV